jgi:hypothetical protein
MYHYKIIEKKKQEETKYRHSLIKSVAEEMIEVFDNITKEQTEMLSLFINHKLFKKYQDIKENQDIDKGNKKTLEEEWAMLKDEPEVLEVTVEKKNNSNLSVKKISRKFIGIQKNKEVD